MKLGVKVDLGRGHMVLDGDPSPSTGTQPPVFSPCILSPIS